jgi:hypothetical protein
MKYASLPEQRFKNQADATGNVIFMLKKAKNLREIYRLPPC